MAKVNQSTACRSLSGDILYPGAVIMGLLSVLGVDGILALNKAWEAWARTDEEFWPYAEWQKDRYLWRYLAETDSD